MMLPAFIDGPIAPDADVTFPLDSVALQREYLEIIEALDGDAPSHALGDEYLMQTNALLKGKPMPWSFVPKVFSRRDLGYLSWIAQTTYRIMDKLTRAHLSDAEVRSKFGFSAELERLTLSPVGYACTIPIARVDIFLNEETGAFHFCELNTDGSAGMLATMEVTRANAATVAGSRFMERHRTGMFDIYSACAGTVLSCYREAGGSSASPVIAAVDYRESVNWQEMLEYRRVFSELGAELRFIDLRDLDYSDGVLSGPDGPVDAVWRRIVLSELDEKPCQGVEAFKRCAAEGKVPMIGGFKTWPCATKTVFAVLHDPVMERHLDAEEIAFVKEHVPATYMLDCDSDLSRFRDRSLWIAKPRDGYNGAGVRAGSECTAGEWEAVLREMASTGGTVQTYVPQYETPNVDGRSASAAVPLAPHSNMEGLYLFGGRFGGVFTRCGTSAVIGAETGRLNMGCLVVD